MLQKLDDLVHLSLNDLLDLVVEDVLHGRPLPLRLKRADAARKVKQQRVALLQLEDDPPAPSDCEVVAYLLHHPKMMQLWQWARMPGDLRSCELEKAGMRHRP